MPVVTRDVEYSARITLYEAGKKVTLVALGRASNRYAAASSKS